MMRVKGLSPDGKKSILAEEEEVAVREWTGVGLGWHGTMWRVKEGKELGVVADQCAPGPLPKGSQQHHKTDIFTAILNMRKLSLRGET